jgi:hypothetical protein
MKWYHGGGKLPKGADILPPTITSVTAGADQIPADLHDTSHVRRDKVHVVNDLDVAIMYACVWGRDAWVYEVTPVGDLEPDPDYTPAVCDPLDCETAPTMSMMCDSAVVVRRLKPSNDRVNAWIDNLRAVGL